MTKITKAASYSRRDAMRLLAAGGVLGLAAPHLLGKPAFAQTPPSAPTGRVIVGLSQEPTVFHPLMAKIEVDDGVHFSIFDALFRITPEGVIVPNLTYSLDHTPCENVRNGRTCVYPDQIQRLFPADQMLQRGRGDLAEVLRRHGGDST